MRDKSDALHHLAQGLTSSKYEKMKMRITHVSIKWYDTFYLCLESTMGKRMIETIIEPYKNQPIDLAIEYKKSDDVRLWNPSLTPNDWVPHSAFNSTCYKCLGDGELACQTCFAKGLVRCDTCRGTGKVDCCYCQGTGYITNTKEDEMCDRCSDGTMTCLVCSGVGETLCEACKGNKTFVCDACNGQRRLYQRMYLRQTEHHLKDVQVVKPIEILTTFNGYNFKYNEDSNRQLRRRLVELSYDGYLEHSEVMLAAKKTYGPAYHQMDKVEAFLKQSKKHAFDERILKQRVEVFTVQHAVVTYRYEQETYNLLFDALNGCYFSSQWPETEVAKPPENILNKYLLWFVIGILVGFLISFLRRMLF